MRAVVIPGSGHPECGEDYEHGTGKETQQAGGSSSGGPSLWFFSCKVFQLHSRFMNRGLFFSYVTVQFHFSFMNRGFLL